VDDDISDYAAIDAVVTVIDAKHIIEHLDEVKPDGVENEAVEQCAFADRFILNKIDLVDEEHLKIVESRIRSINSNAVVIRAKLSENSINVDEILGLKAFQLDTVLKFDPEFLIDKPHLHDNSVTSVGVKFEGELLLFKIQQLISKMLRELGPQLFRYKGVLSLAGMDKKYVFQGVHMLFGGSFSERWKPNEKRENKFCFIGRNLNREQIIKDFRDATLTKPPRFTVGDSVYASVEGGWKKGKIVRVWEEGMVYRIRIDRNDVHAPLDEDAFVQSVAKFEKK
jgi:G3E family GTPase